MLRTLTSLVVRAAAALLLIALSLLLHLPTRVGRIALRDLANRVLPLVVPGHLHVGRVDVLSPFHLRLSEVSFRDDRDLPIVDGVSVTVQAVWRLLPALVSDGPLPAIEVHARRAWTRAPYLVPRSPPSSGAQPLPTGAPPVVLPSLRLTVDELVGVAPDLRLSGRSLQVDMGLRLEGDVTTVDLRNAHATLDAMGLGDERLGARARVVARPDGVVLDATLSLRGASLACELEAHLDTAQRLDARLRRCALSTEALDRLSGTQPERSRRLALQVEEARLTGPLHGEMALHARTAANHQPITLTGRISPARQALEVTLRHLSLDRIVPSAPSTDFDGTIRVEHVPDGNTHEFTVDASALTASVGGVPIPPLRARARLEGSQVTLHELSSPDLGLSMHGTFDLATGETSLHAEGDLDTRDLSRYPWVRGRASGALRAHLEADGRGHQIVARVRGDARHLRIAQVTVREATFEASATHAPNQPHDSATRVAASVTSRGLHVPGVIGPADLSIRAEGNPFGRLRTFVRADGAGLLAALGPPPRHAPTTTSARAEVDLDLTDASRLRARVTRSALRLHGAEARVSGDLTVLSAAQRSVGATGHVRLEAVGHGALDLSLRGQRVMARLDALDLRWFRPLFAGLPADLEGVLDGAVDIDPSRLRDARVAMRIARGRHRTLGGFHGTLELTPEGRVSTLRVVLDSSRGTHAEVTAQATVPTRTNDPDAWIAGIHGAHLALSRIDLAAYDDLLPTGVGMQGHLDATIDATRADPTAPLSLTARIDGRELTAGLRVLSRLFPMVDAFALRGAVCLALQRASLDDTPVRLRVALGPSPRDDGPDPAASCEHASPLLGHPWVALEGSLDGPWLSALRHAARDLVSPGRELGADTRAGLRATTADLRATLGPIQRRAWPFHVPAVRAGADGLRALRPPDLPPDATVTLEATAQGSLLSLGADVEGEFRTSALRQAGLTEPMVLRVALGAHPAEGHTLLGPLAFRANAMIELAPEAPPETHTEIAVDIRAHGTGASLLDRGVEAIALDLFDVDSRNVLLEHFTWARQRGVSGALAVHLRHTDNEAIPLEATATVTGLRTRTTGDDRRESLPVHVGLRTRLVSRGARQGWTLHTCVEASARAIDATCDPLSTQAPEHPGTLRANLSLPVEGALFSPRPRLDQTSATLYARSFRMETFTPLVRSDAIAGVGGALDATLRWQGGGVAPFTGTLRVSQGHADVVSLGERLRDLEVSLRATGTRVLVDRMGFVLGNGRADVDGAIDLAGLLAPRSEGVPSPSTTLADLRLQGEARALPVGVEGNTYGWVDGRMRFGMRLAREGARGELHIERAQVRLKEEQTRDLQPLGPDGDVFILGRTVLNALPSAAPYPMTLSIDLSEPLQIQRSDLALAIRGHVQAHRERAGWGITGLLESPSTQGWFSVLGRRFELDRLRVVLDGSVTINPQLDIAAHHNDVTGDRLTATIGGRLRAPHMEFASANNPGLSQAEILAMIALGRRDAQSANANGDLGQQMGAAFASLVGAMTFGTLSRGLRFVPTLILEPGQGNAGRYGVGASLGPRFYVQVTYGAASSALGQSSTGSAAQVFRGLVEFAISQAWSASISVAGGVGGSSASGGADVFWSP